MNSGRQVQMTVPFTPVVKALVIANVATWVVLQLIVGRFVLVPGTIETYLGLVPGLLVQNFYVWQFATYMFLHSSSVFHILFNMLMLWWLGAELEQRWGARFFLLYYMVSGVGAAILYVLVTLIWAIAQGTAIASVPVVGASGAIFGLLLAYGILFGERVMYFLMLFPMKAKYFVMILGAVELANLFSQGMGSEQANLAHLGGLVAGFLFLKFYTQFRQAKWRSKSTRRGRNLKLVVNNDRSDSKSDGPKYWN